MERLGHGIRWFRDAPFATVAARPPQDKRGGSSTIEQTIGSTTKQHRTSVVEEGRQARLETNWLVVVSG